MYTIKFKNDYYRHCQSRYALTNELNIIADKNGFDFSLVSQNDIEVLENIVYSFIKTGFTALIDQIIVLFEYYRVDIPDFAIIDNEREEIIYKHGEIEEDRYYFD